jgi:hypothetical protein
MRLTDKMPKKARQNRTDKRSYFRIIAVDDSFGSRGTFYEGLSFEGNISLG